MKKQIILFGVIVILIGITLILVEAQVIGNISVSPRCNANGIINIDYAYKIYSNEGHTNYIAIITAGRCERQFRGTINRIINVESAIQLDIRNEISTRAIALYPDPFGDLDVDGRGFFQIP